MNLTLLFFQAISILITAYISILGLKKDLRSTKVITKEIAIRTKRWVIVFTVISILILIRGSIDTKIQETNLINEKRELNDNLTYIKRTNDRLRKTLNNNSIKQSNLIIESQEKSAKELKEAASKLTDLIGGSKEVPVFVFKVANSNTLAGSIVNFSNKPVYNFSV